MNSEISGFGLITLLITVGIIVFVSIMIGRQLEVLSTSTDVDTGETIVEEVKSILDKAQDAADSLEN